jgi:hypothetical protein
MGRYGKHAVALAKGYPNVDLASGWNKSCPKSAFLWLCQNDYVVNIPANDYGVSQDSPNGLYAHNIVRYLIANPEATKAELWDVARIGVTNPAQHENGQADVVMGLLEAGLLKVK